MTQRLNNLILTGSIASLMLFNSIAYSFVDTQGNWAEPSINKLTNMGIMSGYPNGSFAPNGLITRAEFSAVLAKALRLPTYSNNMQNSFVDLKPSYWAYTPIAAVSSNDYVRGYPGNYFYPERNITRAEVLTVITKAARVPMLDNDATEALLKAYPDNQSIPTWARSSVATAIKNGLFRPNNTLDASNYATRGEVATYTDNLMVALGGGQNSNNNTAYIPTQPNTTTSNNTNTSTTTTPVAAVSVVPADTVFSAVLNTAITSDRSQVGDVVTARLDKSIIASDGSIIAPAGSEVRGFITAIEKPQIAEQSASVSVNFNQLVLLNGKTLNIVAQINTKDGSLNAATLPERLINAGGRIVTGTLVGSGAGVLLAALKDKSLINDYLARGAVIGSVAGATSAVVEKGKYLLLLPGDTLQLKLRQALFVNNAS